MAIFDEYFRPVCLTLSCYKFTAVNWKIFIEMNVHDWSLFFRENQHILNVKVNYIYAKFCFKVKTSCYYPTYVKILYIYDSIVSFKKWSSHLLWVKHARFNSYVIHFLSLSLKVGVCGFRFSGTTNVFLST